ncbi:MAG: hypothetical protein P8O76_05545 [Methylophilaceae bacterium]|nr:hypothetical protein [Methylophilaceae bacterium]MDG1445259.1 hypothetical protein [Methylophilaceae bacterium]MDG2292937.1 hypothetical protein [Methylophilaceae bacterium]
MLTAIYQQLIQLFAKPEINAAQAWLASGLEVKHIFWVYATPVNMQLGRDSYFLTNPATTVVTDEESFALMATLNQHFAGLGYYFYLHQHVWFLGLDVNPDITTTPIHLVSNQDIADFLPQGNGALAWNAFQNEIQMLLFSHPVNTAREEQGLPVLNSLWCYGLGACIH